MECVVYCIQKYKSSPGVLVISVDNHVTNNTVSFLKKNPTLTVYEPTISPPLLLYYDYYYCTQTSNTVLLRTLHIEILQHAVVWRCTHAHCTEGVVGKASNEAIDFE